MTFFIPHIKWSPPPYMSIDQIARNSISILQANPNVAAKLGWDLSIPAMSDRVDEFNAARCLQLGFDQFVLAEGGQPDNVPFQEYRRQDRHPSQHNHLSNVVAGGETLVEWIASGAEAVTTDQATARAAVCIGCQHNEKGGLERFFTIPVSNAIRRAYNSRREMKLETPHDTELEICGVCNCPLKLKVHLPIANVMSRIPEATLAQLPGFCWIRKESGK